MPVNLLLLNGSDEKSEPSSRGYKAAFRQGRAVTEQRGEGERLQISLFYSDGQESPGIVH